MTPIKNWFIQNWGIIPQNPRQDKYQKKDNLERIA